MRIEILGSGGAVTIPRPGCDCAVCVEARQKGIPYSRTGPSVFIHDLKLLIDTPEESKFQVNRAGIMQIDAAIYSHWHPDHVMGRRLWESMNARFRTYPLERRTTDIYLPQQVVEDFKTRLGGEEHFAWMARLGVVNMIAVPDGETITLGGVTVRPFRLAEDYVYAFLFEDGEKRILIAPDELYGWQPPEFVHGVDLAIIPMGLNEFDPFTGARVMVEEHPILKSEATFRQTLAMVHAMQPKRTIMTHIEEPDGMNYDDLLRLEIVLRDRGYNITFAYDTMQIEV